MDRVEISYRQLAQIAHPWALLGGILLYALGVGIAVFLGRPIDGQVYLLGQGFVTALQLTSFFLVAYFQTEPDEIRLARRRRAAQAEGEPLPEEAFVPRNLMLLIGISALTIAAALAVLLYAAGAFNPTVLVFVTLAFILAFFYAVPPVQLAESGYGDLTSAIFLANLTPTLGYVLQTGELHRLLAMLTFPLTALYLAMTLALSLQTYYRDLKSQHQTLMVRIGWQRGMTMHNLMILAAYFLIGLAAILGLPWSLTWPALLTIPLGMFQIYQIWQISQGAPPRWRLLRLTAVSTLGLMVYFIAYALWIG
ncbi:MAG TPA: prenyltransferase [Anaerolineaceae bacterium]|nr:prenyltransferase [Anaerolineaceae bacterium]